MAARASYVLNPYVASRRPTREVRVGDVGIGGENPVRVQSMTTTKTLDTCATVDQTERLVAAGCEIVRITAPSIREAENLAEIKNEMARRGVSVPLVADIHFTPNAALIAAEHVEKVRINPGNYADKKKFEVREYTDSQYGEELERVAERFRPLVRRCRELGRAMRIGTNHGSLADRIMNRFGDSPLGMVESALEFLDVCEDENYFDIVFSMKSSNAQVAVQAYRLLASRLEERAGGGPAYPFHLGVTEAGDGDDGRVKSAIGIGALLLDGLGDTVRVSLTEDPVNEVPVAKVLARDFSVQRSRTARPVPEATQTDFVTDPYSHERRATRSVGREGYEIGGAHPVRVEVELGPIPHQATASATEVAHSLERFPELMCEGLLVDVVDPGASEFIEPFAAALAAQGVHAPLAVRAEVAFARPCIGLADRVVVPIGALIDDSDLASVAELAASAGTRIEWSLRGCVEDIPGLLDRAVVAVRAAELDDFIVSVDADRPVHAARLAVAALRERGGADVPLVLRHRSEPEADANRQLLDASVAFGSLLCDGLGDAVAIADGGNPGWALALGYRVLQGARQRTSWTEYISCPSCGRTLFDLEETTARIKARTDHLRGVKIAVMGCIVNGPGEMADADFGYVGSGPGVVNLYVGKELVERKVPQDNADERLIGLIRDRGRWTEP